MQSILARVAELGGSYAVREVEYLDQDFTAEFAAFYSKVFKRHTKICQRFHFFVADLDALQSEPDPRVIAETLELLSTEEKYLGFMVVRPVPHAPVGRSVLAAPKSPDKMKSNLLVRAVYETHLLGATLRVTGVPLVQQDSRIGACAQASIWIAGRHFHTKHRGGWYSSPDITEEASKPTDNILSRSLPAGSGFLSIDNMVRALRAMGREPFAYIAEEIDTKSFPARVRWPKSIRPSDVIHRYVDSGIPVILGLVPWEREHAVGHAIVAVGHTIKELSTTLPDLPTRASFCEAFLVNDDQRGAALRMPLLNGSQVAETPYSVDQHVWYLLIPLPKKVFLPAESAERVAWDLLRRFPTNVDAVKDLPQFKVGLACAAHQNNFITAIRANEIVSRTYLTFGWKYRRRTLRNICSNVVKNVVMGHELPRYVWVTEFGTLKKLNHLEPRDRRIAAHVVTDATSSDFWNGNLIAHFPGMITRWHHDPENIFGDYKFSTIPIPDDQDYYPKVRGLDMPV